MPIVETSQGDILHSSYQTLVCPTNVVGVMGAGLAKHMAYRIVGLKQAYQSACRLGLVGVGKLWVYPCGSNQQILCLSTKKHWKDPSKLAYVEAGLQALVDHYEELGIKGISVPPLGCGLGGLDWETQVKPLIIQYLDPLPIPIELISPY